MQEKQPGSKGLQGCLNHVDNHVAGAKSFHSEEAVTEASADVDHAVPHMKLAPKKHFLSKSCKITEKVDSLHTNKSASENTAEELPSELFEKRNKSTMKVINMRSCIEAIVLSELQKSDSLPSEECSILQVLSMCSGPKGSNSNPGGLTSTYSKKENLVQPKFVGSCDRNNLSSVSWSQEKCLAECIPDRGVLETQGKPSSGPSGRFDMSAQNIKASGNVPNFNQQSARIGADIAAPQDVGYGRWVEQQNVEPSFQLASNLLVKKHSERKPERNPVLRTSEVSEQSQMHSSIYCLRGSEIHEESVNFLKDSYCDSSVRDAFVKTRPLNEDNRFCDSMVIPQSRCPDALTDQCHRNLRLPCENSLGTYGFTRADISSSIQPPPLMSVNSRATDRIPKQAARKRNLLSSPFLTNMQNADFEKKERKEVQEISTCLGFTERNNFLVGPLQSSSFESADVTAMQEVQFTNEVPLDLSLKVESGLYAEDPSQHCSAEASGYLKSPGIRCEITNYSCKRSIGYEPNVGRADQFQQEERRTDGYFPQGQKQVNAQCLTSRQAEYYVGDITKTSSNQDELKSKSNSYKPEVGRLAEYQQTTARHRYYQHPAGYQNEDLKEDGYQTEAFKCLPYQHESGEQKQRSVGNGRRETGWMGMRQQSSSVTFSSLETMQTNAWRSDMDYQAAFDQSGSTQAMLLPISSADIQKPSQGKNNKNSSMSLLTPYDHYSPSSYETGEIPLDGKGLHGVSMQGNIYHPTIMLRSDPNYIDQKCLLMTSEHKAIDKGAFEFGEELSRPRTTHLSGYSPLLPSTCLASPIIPQLSPIVAPGAENRTTSQVAPSIRTTASSLLGSLSPNDILHLQCKLCSSTHGSLRSFRIHFAKVHGQEPLPQHCTILTISEARSVLARYSKQEMALPHLAEELYHKSGNEWTETISGDSRSGLHTSQQKSSLDRSKSRLAVARTKQIAEVYPMPARPSSVSREAKNEPSAAPVKMVLDSINSSEFSKDSPQSAGHIRSCSDLDGLPGGEIPVYADKESDNLKSFCSLCHESYENIEDWKFHVSSVHLMFPCKCKTCKISFVHVTALRKHISVVHCNEAEVVVEYYCLFCWGHFTTEDALYLHVSKEHNEAISEASQGRRRNHTVVLSKDCDSFTERSQADTTSSLEGASDGCENLSTSKRTISNAEVKLYSFDESTLSICADQSKNPALERKQNGDVTLNSSTKIEMKVPQKEVESVEYVKGSCLSKADSQLMNLETVDGCPSSAKHQQRIAVCAADLSEAKAQAKDEIDRYRTLSHMAVGSEAESKPFLLSKKASLLRRFQNDKNSSCLEKTTSEIKEKADTCGHDALKSKYHSLTEVAADDVSTSLHSCDKSRCENATSGQHNTLRHFLDTLLIAEVRRESNSPPTASTSSSMLLQRLVSSKFFPTHSVVHALETDCGRDRNDHDRTSIPLFSSSSTPLQVSLHESAEKVLDRQVSKVTPSKISASSQNESRFLSNRQSELAQNTVDPESVSTGVEHLPKTSVYIHNPEAFSDFIFSPGVLPSDEKSNQNLSNQLRPSKVASSIALESRVNAAQGLRSGVDSHLECKASNAKCANNLHSEHQNFSAEGALAEKRDATDRLISFNVSESSKSCDYCLNTEEDRKENVKRGTVECLNMLPKSCHDQRKNCDTNMSKVQTIDKSKGCGKDSDLVVSASLGSFPVESSLRSNADGIDLVESMATETTSRVLSVPALTDGQHGTSAVGTLQLGSTDISQSQSPRSSGTPHSLKRKYLTSDRELLGDDACDIEMNAKKPLL